MRLGIILRYSGYILIFNGIFLLISAIISLANSDTAWFPLVYSCAISTLFGVFPIIFVPPTTDIRNQEGFVIVVSSWLLSCLIGAIPYILWGGEFTFTNGWFESVSGFTTTGSTILSDVEAVPLGLLFWRSATHWIGGIGIIIFMLSVLPSMGRAGMILYRSEMSSLASDSFRHQTKRTLRILFYVYVGLTVLETIALLCCGMGIFDSITHAFGTIATGGFSTKNASIAHYHSVAVETVVMVFMVLSGMHFGLLFLVITGRVSDLWKSTVIRYYVAALVLGTLVTALNIHGTVFNEWEEALRYAAFQVLSLGTSTGFATTDTSVWPSFAQLTLMFFTFQCACVGSTSGGIKADRFVLFWKAIAKRVLKIKHPRAVVVMKINKTTIDNDTLQSSILYISLYVATVFFSSLLLTFLGVDGLSAFSGSAATMGNVGPGFGIVGSVGNFSQIPDMGKWILTGTMLLGRLEIFGLLLLFMIRSWK
jgi:trk system potassium uptake protein TrkH